VPDVASHPAFNKWLKRLSDQTAKGLVTSWVTKARKGNPGDVKPIGGGVSEARLHYGPG
jgi:putative addiction module killer protein